LVNPSGNWLSLYCVGGSNPSLGANIKTMKRQEMECYIDYLDSKNKFKESRKDFKTYDEALKWMIATFDTVNSDFIFYY